MTRNMSATRAIVTVLALAVLGTTLPARCADPAPAARLPVPSDGDVAKSRKMIRDAYEVEYKAAKESGEPAALLDKLRKDADSAAEPVKKYAFLLEAEDVAAQHDDAAATLAFVDRRAELFEIDSLAERSKTLARLAGPRIVADLALLEQATATATKAAAAERFDIATDSETLALKIAQAIDREQKAAARRRQQRKPAADEVVPAANGVALIKSTLDLQKRIGKQKELFAKYEEAKAVLAAQPDDLAASAAAGTYLCFIARKWDQGLPHLKKSGLAVFCDLAAEELTLGDPASADAGKVFALAGKWWEAGENARHIEGGEDSVYTHAAALYDDVVSRLTDILAKKVAENRRTRPDTRFRAVMFLSDLPEQNVKVNGAMFGKHGRMNHGGPLQVAGHACPQGIFLHPERNGRGKVTYMVPPGCDRFRSRYGVQDGVTSETPLTFKVLDESGSQLWASQPTSHGCPEEECDIRIGDTRSITLVVECPGGCDFAHAIWLDPRFVR